MNRITLFLFAYVLMYSSIFTPKGFVKEKIWQKPLRGVTVQLSLKEDDLRFLAEEWKADSVRLMLMNGDIRNPEPPYSIQENKLKEIDRFLEVCRKYHLRCILDVHETPGRVEWKGKKDRRLWENYEFHGYLNDTWDMLAKRYANWGDVIAGYDLFNEPNMNEQKPGTPSDWNALAKRITVTIRQQDTSHPIIVESINWASTEGFLKLEPIDDPKIIYSFHYYQPMEFTHQGVFDPSPETVSYPGKIKNIEWNKEKIRETLQPVIDFQKKTGSEIYVGEFSVIRWAPGDSGIHYLKDIVDLFEEQGWSWSYHAFREWSGWSLEHEGPEKTNPWTAAPDSPPGTDERVLEKIRQIIKPDIISTGDGQHFFCPSPLEILLWIECSEPSNTTIKFIPPETG